MNAPVTNNAVEPRLTSLSHGGGCGCKIAPGVLSEILKGTAAMPIPPEAAIALPNCPEKSLPVRGITRISSSILNGVRETVPSLNSTGVITKIRYRMTTIGSLALSLAE